MSESECVVGASSANGAGDVPGVAWSLGSNSDDAVRERLDSVEGVGVSGSGTYPNCPFLYFLGARVSSDNVFERLSRESMDCCGEHEWLVRGDDGLEESVVSVK